MDSIPYQIATWIIPVLIAITLHEAAHGFVADKLGDDTARRAGRVSFNPLRHIDPFGTIILPALLIAAHTGFLFGYAKPVPVNFSRLRHPRRDMALVAAAGPLANLLIACIGALAWNLQVVLPGALAEFWADMFLNLIQLNVMLAVFNLLPLPPLDGGRIITALLPRAYAIQFSRIERFGLLILIGLMIVVPLVAQQFGVFFNPIAEILLPVVKVLLWVLEKLFVMV